MTTPEALITDLGRVGVGVNDLWDLVNGSVQYRSAVPVLLDWLVHVDERVPEEQRQILREGLVRALTIPAARPVAAPILINEFRRTIDPSGNALAVVADDSVFEEIESLSRDRSFGKARQMVVMGLGHSKDRVRFPSWSSC